MNPPAYVGDTSIIVQYLVEDNDTPRVDALFAECFSSHIQLWVPDFCLVECANVLWKRVRFDRLSQALAHLIAGQMHLLPIAVAPAQELLPRALQIAISNNLTVYDSVFIALAEKLRYPLITTDRDQEKAALASGVTLKPIADFQTA